MKKKFVFIIVFFTLILSIYISNIYYPLRSYILMYPLKTYYKHTGIFNNIPLKIPTGKINNEGNFYPFTLYYNSDEEFGNYVNKDVQLSIIYNFGGFTFGKKHSYYFDTKSDYYSSFYGAYAIKSNDKTIFGFDNKEKINLDLLSQIPKYDQKYLVMPSIGLSPKDVTFSYSINNITDNINYINSNGWIKIDSNIKTNAPIHKYKKHYNGYIQYGTPKDLKNVKTNYPIINMYGRMYIKYLEEYNSTLVFYILGMNEDIVNKIDTNILSKSYIEKK